MINKALLKAARARVQARAAAAQIPAPSRLLDDDGAPTDALMEFCRETGASLDAIFREPPAAIDYDAARDRLAALCRWTGADLPTWADDVGGADVDVLAQFLAAQGASVDWLCYGTGPEPWSEEGRFLAVSRQLPFEVVKALVDCVKGKATPEQAARELVATGFLEPEREASFFNSTRAAMR